MQNLHCAILAWYHYGMNSAVHLESLVNEIYDYLYANSPVRLPTAIAKEVGKIYRALSYVETQGIKKPIGDGPGITKATAKEIADFVRKHFILANKKSKFYESESDINLTDSNIAFVYQKLHGVEINTTERDVFGDSMEIFRSYWAKSNGGQFFTDQRVTRLAVKLLQFDPLKGDDFVDICAGTGGFLMAAIKHIKEITKGDEVKARKLAAGSILGQEIDKELTEIANSTIAFQLGVSKSANVINGDSIVEFSADKKKKIAYDKHSCLATNPPFGTKITIRDPEILSKYDLAKVYTRSGLFGDESKIIQRAPDVLFIEQNLKLLKPGIGRMAIVVPYQIVSGPQTQYVRNWLLRHAEILAVVDLPPETFQPHTGTKASLLVLRRRKTVLKDIDLSKDRKIFMSTPKWIGHDRRGNPTYKKSEDGSITDSILTDFPVVENDFKKFIEESVDFSQSQISFAVEPERIKNDPHLRLDARYYRSHRNNSHHTNIKKAAGWDYVRLGDVVESIFYPGRFARNYVSTDTDSIPFLGGTNVTQLLLRTEKRIARNSHKIEELKVKQGWILITRSGSVGIVSTVPQSWDGYAFSEHVIRIVPNDEKLAREYLFAFLKTRFAQEIIARGVYGSVIDEITPEYIGKLEVPVPKDRKKLEQVIQKIKSGEAEREKAIQNLLAGIDSLERLLAS